MDKKVYLLFFSFIFFGCSTTNVRDCTSFIKNNVGHPYSLKTMCDYHEKIVKKLDSGNELLVVTYKDNSKIFISNEIEYCPSFSILFLTKNETGMITFNDTLVLNGITDKSTSWRIEKRDGFILGYYDVPIKVESSYRDLILSLRSK